MKNKSECKTLVRIEGDNQIFKDKKKFTTLDAAIEECKYLNSLSHRINKVVAYKCKSCCQYHIGRNGKPITDKLRNKLCK